MATMYYGQTLSMVLPFAYSGPAKSLAAWFKIIKDNNGSAAGSGNVSGATPINAPAGSNQSFSPTIRLGPSVGSDYNTLPGGTYGIAYAVFDITDNNNWIALASGQMNVTEGASLGTPTITIA